MLRQADASKGRQALGVALAAGVGVAAAALVALGNPGNMGLCGACFLRDAAGALKLFAAGPAYLRPEIAGLVLGALLAALLGKRFAARSGGFTAGRFVLCLWMAVAALVFLGCPFRMLQRLGGGDLHAWLGLPGFVLGVAVGRWFEARGYSAGKTAPAPAALGLLGPAVMLGLLVLFLVGGVLAGPGANDATPKPPHAPWGWALSVALICGAALSMTGFCAVSSVRQAFTAHRAMTWASLALIAGYGVTALVMGRAQWAWQPQPVAHGDALWNGLALALLGLTGALAGGCPVRQLVMAGEGNGDAFVGVCGLALGGALAHNFGLVSVAAGAEAAGGPTAAGRAAVIAGLIFCVAYAFAVQRFLKQALPPAA